MRYRKFSIHFKLKCLNLVKQKGLYKTSKITGIDKTYFIKWKLNKAKFEKINKKKSTFRLPKIKQTKILEKNLILFINRCKEIGIPLTLTLILNQMYDMNPHLKNVLKNTLRRWVYRFLKKNNYNINELKQ